ncbi:hypothetical protein [Sphaerisporangium rubeum]|uniref:Chitin-binding type-2 domain-containing protein n=1 Tax=Sphaerisporangium rubeum TaxID=321317 RepID=A0A7X0IFS5_9ACTN|nr:hypothetical protein [Sphaerisporangium rubeum]MBB6472872.1 hypothetical protein [Sphaerisporangium rubeum]
MKIKTMLGVAATALIMVVGALTPADAAAAPPGARVTSTSATEGTMTSTSSEATRTKGEGRSALASNQTAESDRAAVFAATCYNAYVAGRNFYMTCTSDAYGYRVYVDCSNGFRYYFGTLYFGTWNHVLTCPVGTYAVWGGWWL